MIKSIQQTKPFEKRIYLNDAISFATQKNWNRLSVSNRKERCSARANKRMSEKYIIPKESFDNLENVVPIEELVCKIKKSNCEITDAIYSLGINLLNKAGILDENMDCIKSEYGLNELREFSTINLPNESDLLGIVYQCLQTEGQKNIKGSYYTPKKVVQSMVSNIVLKPDDKVLDPCCGSLVFLLNIPNITPGQIHGVDIDPVAVMIAKINYFLKFPTTTIKPKIYEADYLDSNSLLDIRIDEYKKDITTNNFNYIITNPPWGAVGSASRAGVNDVASNEVFSLFLVSSFRQLANNGNMRFLLPCSILNVKTHHDIRKYLLEKTDLKEIKLHPGAFSGVMTQYISLEADKKDAISKTFFISDKDKKHTVEKRTLCDENNYTINVVNDVDKKIMDFVFAQKKYDLNASIWGLGIVTGDNRGKLSDEPKEGFEPIYTGKEIAPFKLKKARKYVLYNRSHFQQAAKDEIYRADEKLAYKFISTKLVFSMDDSRQLFLNSANIVIPKIPNMSMYSVAAFLNSELYQYLYQKLFGGIKVLKSSLTALPFVEITREQNEKLSGMVREILTSENTGSPDFQSYIYHLFGLDDGHINHIKRELHGNLG